MLAGELNRISSGTAGFCRKDIVYALQGSGAIDGGDKRFPAQRRVFKVRI